jgi:TonB-linked SusC/RagA family outer membrane protein
MLTEYFKTIKLILLLSIFASATTIAQVSHKVLINITGKVVNDEGDPVLATVSVKGSDKATGTDADGNFTLKEISPSATLIISGINIWPLEIKVGARNNLGSLTVTAKVVANKEISIQANTGYQTVNPNEVNGSLVVIDNKMLNQQVGPGILKRLDGITPGLYFNIGKSSNNPQNNTNISIRGLSTINGPLDPIIVLDNFIYEGDFNNINPNDIESITVLKDAAATSIYGARGGNGVIVITTKKAKFGQKVKIDFNSTITVTSKPNLEYLKQMSSSDYIDVEQYIFNQGYFNTQIRKHGYQALTPAVAVFLKRSRGLISAADSASQIDELKSVDNVDQYQRLFYRKAVLQQYGLNLSGGGKNIAWLVSGAYNADISSLKATDNKANIHFENTYRPLKNLQIRVGIYYTNNNTVNGEPAYNTISVGNRQSVPYISFADKEGNSLPVSPIYRKDYVDSITGGKLLDWDYYPLTDYKHDVTKNKREDYSSNLEVNYSFLQSLQLSVHYQYERQVSTTTRTADDQSYYTRDLINNFSQIDRASGDVTYVVPHGGILKAFQSELNSQNFRAQLNFNRQFGSHSISAIAGNEIREVVNNGNGSTIYGYKKQPLSYAAVDFTNFYLTSIMGSYLNIPGNPYVNSTTNNRFVSLFANVSYQYKKRYSISGSIRKDGSNIFGLKTNDKWQPLWSAGAGWILSGEPFYKSAIFPFLKFRVTYGVSGNVDLSKSPLPIAYTDLNYVTNLPFSRIVTINNPELRWEQSKQINFAMDFQLIHQILSGTIEYYTKNGTNLYGETPYDYTAWGGSAEIVKNVADMRGHGMDISFQTKNIGNKIKWNSTLILSYNESKTTKYYSKNAQNINSLLGGSGNTIIPVVGRPLYGIVAFTWAGLDNQGNPQGILDGQKSIDYNSIINSANSKQLNSGSIKYIGAATPAIFGSLINTFTWRQFSLLFNISYRFGYYFKKQTINYDALINSGIGNSDYDKRWQNAGDELKTDIPSFVYTSYPQFGNRSYFFSNAEITVLKAGNVRLQYVNVSYALSAKRNNKLFEAVELYINAADLGILWRANKEKLDPDYPGSLPLSKSYSIGLRATF